MFQFFGSLGIVLVGRHAIGQHDVGYAAVPMVVDVGQVGNGGGVL